MNQSVITFASVAARNAAIPAPLEGQLVWLEDSNKYVYYSGSAWVDLLVPASSGNAIINGAFDIWQRGTSVTGFSSGTFLADRFNSQYDGTGATRTLSQQTFTPGTAPVAGYESQFFLRYAKTVAGTSNTFEALIHPIEDARTFAGQAVTLSFWAKAAAATTLSGIRALQLFGSGGSSPVSTSFTPASISLTTSWQRFSLTATIASVTGLTIGAGSQLRLDIMLPTGSNTFTVDIWGVQLEAGSTATPFRRNANNIQGELAACQRYHWRFDSKNDPSAFANFGLIAVNSTTLGYGHIRMPVSMRTAPSITPSGSFIQYDTGTGRAATVSAVRSSTDAAFIATTGTGYTAGRVNWLEANNNNTCFIDFSAEL
jgi:hypothetical protein